MFERNGSVKKRNPWLTRILALTLVIAIIASGVGVVFGSEGTFELVDEDGVEQLYIRGSWIKVGWSKRLSIIEGAVTLPDGTFGIISGDGWAECDGTIKLTFTIEMGPFLEPCDDEEQPPCEPCPQPCPSPCLPSCPPCPSPTPFPCPSPTPQPCGKCKGVRSLTLKYTGSGTVQITAYHGSKTLGKWVISPGQSFTVYPESGKEKLPANTYFKIDGEIVKIHTSCSQPLDAGMTFGRLYVISVNKVLEKDGKCKGKDYDSSEQWSGYTSNNQVFNSYGACRSSGCSITSNCDESGSKCRCSDYDRKRTNCEYSYGCDVSDNCCNCQCGKTQCRPKPVKYCEKYRTVAIRLQGKSCNTVRIQEVVGRILQPCDKEPTYLYRYSYQSEFNIGGTLETDEYVSFSGTFYWRETDTWWSRCYPCSSGDCGGC